MQAVKRTYVHTNGEKYHLVQKPPSISKPSKPRPPLPLYRRRSFLIAAVSILLLAALAFVFLIVYWPFSRARVTNSLEDAFSGKIVFASFHATHFPHPGCVAEGVVFTRQPVSPDSPPLATIQRLTIQANYVDLLTRPGYISRMLLEGLRIHIPPIGSSATSHRSSSSPDTSSHSRIGELVADGAFLEIARRNGHEPLKFDIHSLTLNSVRDDGPFSYRIVFLNPLPPGQIRARGRFGPWNSANPAQIPFSGTYSFDDADLSVFHGIAGMLSSQGDFQGRLGDIGTHGAINIPDFSITRSHHAVPLRSQFRAHVNGTNGDVFLDHVDTSILQTQVAASGNIAGRPGQHGKTAAIDFAVNHGRIEDVMRLFVRDPRPPLDGETSFHAHVTIPPSPQPFMQKFRLVGDFTVAGGRFTKPSRQTSIQQLSDRAGGKKPDATREDDPAGVVSDLSGHVDVQRATATLTNLSFSVPNALAQMHGTYNLMNQKVDLHGTLQTTAKFSQTTSGIKSVLLKPLDLVFRRKPQGATIPVHLTGTYYNPQPGLDLIPKKD